MEYMAFMEKHKEELAKLPVEERQVFAELKTQGAKFIKACEVEEAAKKNVEKAEEARSASFADIRDYLLIAKTNGQWGNRPMGMS